MVSNCAFICMITPILILIVGIPTIFIPLPSAKLKIESDTKIFVNFTDGNVTLGGDISIDFTSYSFNSWVQIFYNNITLSVFYNLKDKPSHEFLLVSTYLPSISYVDTQTRGMCTSRIHESTTVNNTIGVELMSFFLRLSASIRFQGLTFFHHKSDFLNVSCHHLTSQLSNNATKNVTTVSLTGISC